MKLQLLILCCVLQSIYGYDISDEIIYPPDVRSTRIVGGEDAPDGYAPFQCSMQVNRRHFCGCSILKSKWIVTASHCVAGQSTGNVEILVGTNDLNKGGVYHQVEKFIMHEGYNRPAFANDIALVKLRKDLEFNDRVAPISYSYDEVDDGEELELTGWGRLRAGGELPQKLQVIKLKAVSTKRCKEIYGGQNVHDSHICTLTRVGEGACNGDSGGPLFLGDRLIGVVNFGVPCGRGFPDAYAKVSYLAPWIDEHIDTY